MMDLMCLVCVMERKYFDQTPMEARPVGQEPPDMRPAVTMCATNINPLTLICYEHLALPSQSPLLIPNGQPLPPPPGGMHRG